VDDRHRGGQDLLAQGVACALELHRPAIERGGDLRATAVAGSDLRRARAVGQHHTGAVDDQHPSVHRAPRGTGETREFTPPGMAQQIRGGGRRQVGLSPRLGADLGAHAGFQAQRERHAERDDRQRYRRGGQ
jgi:hypothetical protein